MKTKRFQWLSDLRKLVRNNLCWWLRRKNRRRNEYNLHCDTESLSEYSFSSFRDSIRLKSKIPVTDLSSSSYQDCSSVDYVCSDTIDDIEDESGLIILTKKNTTQLPFPGVRRNTNTLPVIPLPFINSVASIREGNIIEFQMKLPETISYEDLIFNTISSTIFTASWGSYPFLFDKMRVVPYPDKSFFSIAKEMFNRQDNVVFNEYPISSYADSDLGAGESIYLSLQGLINAIDNKLFNVQKEFSYNSTDRDLQVLDINIKTELTEGNTEAVDNSFPKTTLEEGSAINGQLPSTIRHVHMLSSAAESRISASSHGDCALIAKETPFDPFLESSNVFSARQTINQQGKRLAGNLYTTQRQGNNLDFNTAINISLQQFVDAKDIPNSKIFSEFMETTRLQQFTNSDIKVQTKTILVEMAREGTREDVLIPKRSFQRHIPDSISSEWLPTMEGFDILWSQTDCMLEKLSFTAALEDGRHKTLLRGSYGHIRLVAAVYKDVMKQVNTDCLATIKSPYLAQLFGVFHGMDQRWVVYHEANYGDLDTFLQLDIQREVIGEKVARFVVANVLLALHYLHGHGISHGDVRPSKVLINVLGQPILGGLETVFWPCNRTLMRRSAMATKIGFVAPEIVKKSKPNPVSDVFAVGCLGYFIVTGRYPFATKNELLCYKTAPTFSINDFSYAGEQFLGACLQKRRAKRFKLDSTLKKIFRDEWFSNFDVGAVFQNSPIMAAIECINKKIPLTPDEKRVSFICWENNINFLSPTQLTCNTASY